MNAALYATIWLALGCFAAGEAGKRHLTGGTRLRPWAWPVWTLGATLCVAHLLIALADRYDWNHGAAVNAAATRAAAVYGIAWSGSIFVNYLFVSIWVAEAIWWKLGPDSYFARPNAVTLLLRGFYLIIMVNAAVVFASLPGRAVGLVLVGLLVWTWRPASPSLKIAARI